MIWLSRKAWARLEAIAERCEQAANACEAAADRCEAVLHSCDAATFGVRANQMGELVKVLGKECDRVHSAVSGLYGSRQRADATIERSVRAHGERVQQALTQRVDGMTALLANIPLVESAPSIPVDEWSAGEV